MTFTPHDVYVAVFTRRRTPRQALRINLFSRSLVHCRRSIRSFDDGYGFPQEQDNSNKIPPIFGAESMREARLEPSLLGSIVPKLDPDPPDPQRSNAFMADHTSPPAGAGAKRPRPSVAPAVAGTPSAPVSGKEGPREWAGGVAATAEDEGTGGAGGGLACGVVPGQQEAEVARRRKSRVKHGLRVLLRGTSRYQVLALPTRTLGSLQAFLQSFQRKRNCARAVHIIVNVFPAIECTVFRS